ncbi:MAG TPA: hypothetical protein VFE24_10945 [Pirellulales bacterium]|jgi:uncharacterized lipoprotein NlpE involved in copper resistance|nr:hypothetical protein [Pirellulales bacterium]
MKKSIASLLVCGLVALVGCNNKSAPGGPNANPENKPMVGTAENSFTISAPNESLNQGDSKSATISISRGKNFDQDVSLSFMQLPTGVTVSPATAMLSKADKEVKVNIDAAADAAVGDFTAQVMAHPQTGADTKVDMKIKVSKK